MQKKVVGKDADILLLDARASGGTARLLEIAVHSYHGDAVDKRSSAVRWRVLTVFLMKGTCNVPTTLISIGCVH